MATMKTSKNIPVHIVEPHNDVVPFIHRTIASKKLPYSDMVMIHFDSHPDLLIPVNLQADVVFEPPVLYESQSIENWLLPLTYAKHINHIVWIKPPWANQIKASEQTFIIGKCEQSGKLRLSCKENYFLTDGLFRPAKNLVDTNEVTLTVLELHPDKWGELDASYVPANPVSSPDQSDKTEGEPRHIFSIPYKWVGYLQELIKDKAYILDIDLDFFSTANPFRSFVRPEEESALKRLYHYPALTNFSDESIIAFTEAREKQINQLETIFCNLEMVRTGEVIEMTSEELEHTTLSDLLGEDDEKYLQDLSTQQQDDLLYLCKSLARHCTERELNFIQFHDFGCTLDDTELPHHISTPQQVAALQALFKTVLEQLPQPGVVTIARSSDDEYCPKTVVDQFQEDVLKILRDVYGSLQITMNYE